MLTCLKCRKGSVCAFWDKSNLLEDVNKGMKKKDVATKYTIASSSVSTIFINRCAIREHTISKILIGKDLNVHMTTPIMLF